MSLHPQVVSLVRAAMTPDGEPGPADLEAERAGYLREAIERGGPIEEVARVEDVVIPRADGGRMRARAYWPSVPAETTGTFVWLHGGGWFVGDLDGTDRIARQLANASGAVCLSVDYRLAPEAPFPAAVDDARTAVVWAAGDGAAQLGTDPARVVVGGDSSGGNLAVAAARHERGAVRGQALAYPALDGTMSGASYAEHAEGPMLHPVDMETCWTRYLAGADPTDPDATPMLASDLRGVAPALVAVAGHDILRDDGLRYADALRAAGVEVRVEVFEDMIHGFLRWGGIVERARELVESLAGFAREAIAR